MKNSLRTILILSFSIILICSFFVPKTTAQEWTYDGVETERIPEFSVYSSEWYVYNNSAYGIAFNHTIYEVVKANISNTFMGMASLPPYYGTFTNGTSIYVNLAKWNTTTDEKYWNVENAQFIYWNGTAYLSLGATWIPIDESTGKVTEDIMEIVMDSMPWLFSVQKLPKFEHNATYPNRYSFRFWNTTAPYAYININFTESGILNKVESYPVIGPTNMTLYSKPAQNPPDFDFTTETGSLTVNSTEFKLNITIIDADNNNDGDVDTDYLYRIQNGTEWSDWSDPPNLLDWDLGDVEEGDYDITVEVKNMYGVTQEEITIEYEPPPKKKRGAIPSYPIAMISLIVIFGISIIIHKYRKKLTL